MFVIPVGQLFDAPGSGNREEETQGSVNPAENRTFLNFVHPTPPKDEAEKDGFDETMHFLRDVVRDEDYDLNFKIQRGLLANPFENITFGRNEQGNQYFHKWVDYYLDDDPEALPPTL